MTDAARELPLRGSEVQMCGATVPAQGDEPLVEHSRFVVSGDSIVFVPMQTPLWPRPHMQREGFARRLLRGVAHGRQGQNAAGPDIDRNPIQGCFGEHRLSAHLAFARPEIVPDIVGQIDAAGGAPGFQHRSDQEISAEQELRVAGHGDRIVGVLVEQGSNQWLALSGCSLSQAVKERKELIAQAKGLPSNNFHLWTEGPGFLIPCAQVAVVAEIGGEGRELKPPHEEFRCGVAQESSDIAAAEWDSAQ